jgi:ABC-type phosphate transport system substrate-binding protein
MCDKKTMVGITLLISAILLAAIIPQTITNYIRESLRTTSRYYCWTKSRLNKHQRSGCNFSLPVNRHLASWIPKIKPDENINYQSIGSGGGVKQFTTKTVDFGASDAPLSAAEQQKVPGAVHIPETIGAVVAAYNIPSLPNKGLKLTGPILSDIFLGKIKKMEWPKDSINELRCVVTFWWYSGYP